MNQIKINGKVIDVEGRNITLKNGKIMVNEKVCAEKLSGEVILRFEGDLANLKADGDVQCANVSGMLDCKGSVDCEDVDGDIDCGGSVKANNIKGNIDCAGSVKANKIEGQIDAGGSVSHG